ncbi:MAG: RNA ligase RtcB family protein [Candidatus Melainabacteria bacterium HGW-Melainabacteria-1]|nr:MAG: RNA ligase RtcB family protein [Candidatus Melainabacteria bacterium HGW-Melainabacteria-1]
MSEQRPIDAVNWRVIASAQSWIEGAAVEQLKLTAKMPGMLAVWGLPDLHPGKGTPIGAAFLNQDRIYPHLVGNDIGCGMGLWQSDLPLRKAKPEKWFHRLTGLEGPWSGDTQAWLTQWGLEPSGFEAALGTIGGGNHFAELQKLQTVHDQAALRVAGLDPERLVLLVHSGSRGLGEAVLRAHTDVHGAAGLTAISEAAAAYLADHDRAVIWAEANRALIAARLLEVLGAAAERCLDICHNQVVRRPEGWLHRKGAAPADCGLAVIPGSRGSLSYLVEPLSSADSGWSIAHGAGRKWNRHDSKARLKDRYKPEDLYKTRIGSWVICQDRDLLYEEAPAAYKPIDQVIQDLVAAGLIRVIAELSPLLTYKLRRDQP